MIEKQHLGDNVYAEERHYGSIVLTTAEFEVSPEGNSSSTIFLKPMVFNALVEYEHRMARAHEKELIAAANVEENDIAG